MDLWLGVNGCTKRRSVRIVMKLSGFFSGSFFRYFGACW